ncbi:MAG TPA: exo-beta-N-acetylmuramidase NamZ domain-containing protein [Polyangiaceae bacterium]|nr:exo-beta-N-acetylmuramidase NamZ domain-containing protein [Polyangiaceae bacterium]
MCPLLGGVRPPPRPLRSSLGRITAPIVGGLALCVALACAGGTTNAPPAPDVALASAAPAAALTPAAAAPAPSPAPAAPPEPLPLDIPAIDALVNQALAEHRMPGAVVIIGRGSGVYFRRAYGQRAILPAPLPMTTTTIFDLASLTKPIVTASLVQSLVDRRLLDLDDPVSKYVSAFGSRGKAAVTVRQLLEHTGGLPIVNPLKDYKDGPERAYERVFDQRLENAPGQNYLYGDLSYIVLGALVERVSGERLDALAKRVLFEPLGMRETGYLPPRSELARIAPTEVADERPIPLIHGEVHDPRAWLLGGVAGNAGLFSTADDVARFARMLLGEGELDGVRVLSRASVQELTRPEHVPGAVRTPGWDVVSSYSKARGRFLSARAFGHGGYTGTSLWIDPQLDLFVGFLSNRVHPKPEKSVIALEGDIADAAVAALAPTPPACAAPQRPVLAGIDVLESRGFDSLRGRRVGLVTHRAAIDAQGRTTLDVLASAPEVKLTSLMTPEHGFDASSEGKIASSFDAGRSLPVYSLYGSTLEPTADMLSDVDVIVVDLVDVGTRYYTYMSTLHRTLRAAAKFRIPVVVLDRPNPIGGVAVEGPMLEAAYENFVNYHPLPVRHGMTAGELAELINEERGLGARLEIVPAAGWTRTLLQSDTGLRWENPSPNLRDFEAALLYPAIGLVEATNVSVGRGTDRPFHVIGAPYVDGKAMLRALRAAALPGVEFSEVDFVPDAAPHQGQHCHGVSATVTDPLAFRPVLTGLTLARVLLHQNAKKLQANGRTLIRLVGNRAVVDAVGGRAPMADVERSWQPELDAFRERRARHLLYPDCTAIGPSTGLL